MTDWKRNAFWSDIVARLEHEESALHSAPMVHRDGAWIATGAPGLATPPVLLQGRRLVVDVSDRALSLLPLGRGGRFHLDLPLAAHGTETIAGVGWAVVRDANTELEVRVSGSLPIVEIVVRRGESPTALSWRGIDDPPTDGAFVHPRDFDQDAVAERNNSVAPDPLPLPDSPRAGAAIRQLDGRIVIAVETSAEAAHAALEAWEDRRSDERSEWDRIARHLSIVVPDASISRQLPYSVHNSLFSRSLDGSGRDIFVHGRRDRGYADTAHLHQSYQMHLPALAAGEGASVRDELLAFAALQDGDGWLGQAPRPLRGSSAYVGRYTNVHLLMAAHRYLAWTGDGTLFQERVTSRFDPVERRFVERVDRAADDLLTHRHDGLVEPCGWADAWNPAVRAQGQISAAAVLGLRAWADVSEHLGRDGTRWRTAASEIVDRIRAVLLDPDTGIVAEHLFDTGVEGGRPDDYWAHTQIWSALANVVDDGRALDHVARDCLDHGMSIAPASAFDRDYVVDSTDATAALPVESTATWLLASWPEVTHLYALAELDRGRPGAALQAVLSQLPETLHRLNPVAAPFYYAEKYLAPGTRPWLCTWAGDPSLIEVVMTGFFGVQAELDGIQIAPQWPDAWAGAPGSVQFAWRGAAITVEAADDLLAGEQELDGIRVTNGLTRITPDGRDHVVRISSTPYAQTIA